MNKLLKITATLAAIILFAACGNNEEEKKPVVPPPAEVYRTMILQSRSISGEVRLPGVMQPFQFVHLFPKINGFVKTVAVDRGSLVRQGQVLLTLEAPEVTQQVAAAKLKYTQAQASYFTSKDRYRRMKETSLTPGTISPYDLEAAASRMQGDSATAQGEYASYRAQEAMRSYLTITAPFDGVITERNIHPGALAGPGTPGAKPMLVLQQQSRLRLVVEIPEQYAAQVKDGGEVHYTVNAQPGQTFTGTVSRSGQSLSSNYRAETIEIDVDNSANIFKPGMYAEVLLPTSGNSRAFLVPRSAIVVTTERKYVLAVDNNIARRTDVTEGNLAADSAEIFCNLRPGAEIITNAGYQVKDGTVVR